jgi:uncharacterized protein (DUF1015 family)
MKNIKPNSSFDGFHHWCMMKNKKPHSRFYVFHQTVMKHIKPGIMKNITLHFYSNGIIKVREGVYFKPPLPRRVVLLMALLLRVNLRLLHMMHNSNG